MAFIECKIDTTDLMRAQAIFTEYGKTVPAMALNRTVLFITKAARDKTGRVSIGRIDAELAVEVIPKIGKRGKPLSMKSAKNRVYKSNVGPSFKPPIPFTYLLVGARANPDSRFNRLTSSRYAIHGGHPFAGQSVSRFAQIMQDRVTRMVKNRHSGSGFFQQSWGAIIAKLIPHVPASYRRGFGSLIGRRTKSELGSVTPAVVGDTNPSCVIELNLGMEGQYPAMDDQRNQAMHKILGPILQQSIDEEWESKMAEAAKQGWIERSAELKALGIEVSF